MKIVVCECGTQNVAKKGKYLGTFGHMFLWSIQCSHDFCFREAFGNSEEEVIEKWNKRIDWWVHEPISVYSESEYKKLVEEVGGAIIETPHWTKRKNLPCPHCKLRERIKEEVIKEMNNAKTGKRKFF